MKGVLNLWTDISHRVIRSSYPAMLYWPFPRHFCEKQIKDAHNFTQEEDMKLNKTCLGCQIKYKNLGIFFGAEYKSILDDENIFWMFEAK